MHSAWCHFSRVGAGAGRTGVENRGAASMRSVRAPAHRAARRSTTPIQPRRADAGAPSAWYACSLLSSPPLTMKPFAQSPPSAFAPVATQFNSFPTG